MYMCMCVPGQFGTRLQGGKDAAGARYIMTRLDKIARVVFHEHDDKLLDYLKEEGQSIEPHWCALPVPLTSGKTRADLCICSSDCQSVMKSMTILPLHESALYRLAT